MCACSLVVNIACDIRVAGMCVMSEFGCFMCIFVSIGLRV